MKYETFISIIIQQNINSNAMAQKHENELESSNMTLMYMRMHGFDNCLNISM